MLNSLSGIRILSVDREDNKTRIDFYKELESSGFFKDNNYESLMDVTEKNQVVRFYAKSAPDNKFSELLLVVGGEDNTLISIRGSIDPEHISKLSGALDINVSSGDSKK